MSTSWNPNSSTSHGHGRCLQSACLFFLPFTESSQIHLSEFVLIYVGVWLSDALMFWLHGLQGTSVSFFWNIWESVSQSVSHIWHFLAYCLSYSIMLLCWNLHYVTSSQFSFLKFECRIRLTCRKWEAMPAQSSCLWLVHFHNQNKSMNRLFERHTLEFLHH